MTFQVPFLPDADIEAEANKLLKSFEGRYGAIKTIATPLEEIVENHLGLTFEISDLGHPEILGQLDIKSNTIRINVILDPIENPRMEGRHNFTLAHEVAHNVVHRPYAEAIMAMPTFFDNEPQDIILCRIEDHREPIEIQADKFASCLLMPREKLKNEFSSLTNRPFLEMEGMTASLRHNHDFMNPIWPDWRIVPNDDEILGHAFRPLAEAFRVSRTAMFIRLKSLGLLRNASEQMFNMS